MTPPRMMNVVVALLLASGAAGAQECASAPLMGARFATGPQLGRSDGENAYGWFATGAVRGAVRATAGYVAARSSDVGRTAHGGQLELAAATSVRGVEVCPLAGGGLSRLSATLDGTNGRVDTRELWAGASLGHAFAPAAGYRLTPFVQPMLVRRSVDWKSDDSAGWRIADRQSASAAEMWLGVTASTRQLALVARARPGRRDAPAAASLGVRAGLR